MTRRRILLYMGTALWVTLWPHNYGYDAHNAWLRLGAVLLLVIRALFIGYCVSVAIVSPLLTWRTGPDQPPFPTALQAVKRLAKEFRHADQDH